MGEIDRDYQAAGFGGTLTFGRKPALIIVDMVKAYLDPDCPLYAGPTAQLALGAMIRLRVKARALGIPVIITGVSYRPGGTDGGLFYRKVPALALFDKGSPHADFPENLSPEEDDVCILKQYPSAFFATSLASMLVAQNIDTVLIGGYSTSGCVRATALDALQHGFAPFVVRETCADRHAAPHEASLFDLQAKYAEVVSLDWALQRLSQSPLPA